MKTNLTLITLLSTLMVLTCLPEKVAAQQEPDQVSIRVLNSDAEALPDVRVDLIAYRFNARGTTAEAIPAGSCSTDNNGRCQIMVRADAPKDPSGFLRGVLDLGKHGKRSVLWPGGLFEITVQLNPAGKLETEGEAAPFDYDEPGAVQVIQPQPPFYLVGILLAVFFIGLAFFLYRRSKAQ